MSFQPTFLSSYWVFVSKFRLLVLFGRKVLSDSIGVSFKLWVFTNLGFMFYLVLAFYPLVLLFLSSLFQVDRLLVLFGRKILSINIGVSFKLWVFTSHFFMFFLVLWFYPLVLEIISSCEFSPATSLVLFSPRVLSVSIGVSFKLWVFNHLLLFYLDLRFYPLVLEFLSSCEFSSNSASCFV